MSLAIQIIYGSLLPCAYPTSRTSPPTRGHWAVHSPIQEGQHQSTFPRHAEPGCGHTNTLPNLGSHMRCAVGYLQPPQGESWGCPHSGTQDTSNHCAMFPEWLPPPHGGSFHSYPHHHVCAHWCYPGGGWVVISVVWWWKLDEWAVEFGEIIKEPDSHNAPDNK